MAKKGAKKPREVSEFAFFTRPKVCNREMAPKIKKNKHFRRGAAGKILKILWNSL